MKPKLSEPAICICANASSEQLLETSGAGCPVMTEREAGVSGRCSIATSWASTAAETPSREGAAAIAMTYMTGSGS